MKQRTVMDRSSGTPKMRRAAEAGLEAISLDEKNAASIRQMLAHGVLFAYEGGPRPRINDVTLCEGKTEADLLAFLRRKSKTPLASSGSKKIAEVLTAAEKAGMITLRFKEYASDVNPSMGSLTGYSFP